MAAKIKRGPAGLVDMLRFRNTAERRDKVIEKADLCDIECSWPINENAERLHPDILHLVIDDIIEHEYIDAKTYILKKRDNSPLPFFRAGEYLSIKLHIGDSFLTRPYSISSSPKAAGGGRYEITVCSKKSGFASDWILSSWKKGDEIISSSPLGDFCYEPLRDSRYVVALAGGSGITPFLSMARAIEDGTEDFNLLILYGSRTEKTILFKDELKKIEENSPKVKVVHVLSDEDKSGYEHGFMTSSLIRKYAPLGERYSVFFCGPEEMYRFISNEIKTLGIEAKDFRRELNFVSKVNEERGGEIYSIRVRQCKKVYVIPGRSDETILTALERAGIKAPSRCRGGECGWCRSRLLSGSVFIPEENDRRRYGDRVYNYIHPCSSFPAGDSTIEVPGEY